VVLPTPVYGSTSCGTEKNVMELQIYVSAVLMPRDIQILYLLLHGRLYYLSMNITFEADFLKCSGSRLKHFALAFVADDLK